MALSDEQRLRFHFMLSTNMETMLACVSFIISGMTKISTPMDAEKNFTIQTKRNEYER